MKQVHVGSLVLMVLLCVSLFGQAQQSVAANGSAVVPPLVNFSGVLTDINGKPLTGMLGVTFYLYKDQQGGSPLWLETQNVQPDKTGHYTVLLGSTTSQGLPASIFTLGEAHWLGVQAQGQEEQPRVLLVSAPYALKAGDAETVGGFPPSAFVLAAPGSSGSGDTPNDGTAIANETAVVSGSGTSDFIPLWTSSTVLSNSILFQSSGSPASIGINTTTPAATLDVNGGVIARGALQLPSTGTANSGSGFNSQPFSLQGSAFNSGTGKAIGPLFQWQTEPTGNNSSNPAGTLNLLYGSGSGSPSETGLNIASNGKITFASGQTFPGTGTVTGVTAGTDLTGGGTNGNVTLNLDTTKVPQLNVANTFVGNQAITGNLTDTGNITATGSITGQTENLSATTNTGEVLNVTQSGSAYGINVTAPSGAAGVQAVALDVGVSGTANFTGGGGVGVLGTATNGNGVYGQDFATSGTSTGVTGVSFSSKGVGVIGQATSNPSSATSTGVEGLGAKIGVYGNAGGGSSVPNQVGVYGTTNGPINLNTLVAAVEGVNTGGGGAGGVFYGSPPNPSFVGPTFSTGVFGEGGDDTTTSGAIAGIGGAFFGGNSQNGFPGDGLEAQAGTGPASPVPIAGVSAYTNGAGPGAFGHDATLSNTGGGFVGNDYGVWGDTSTGQAGILATSDNGFGLFASNDSGGTAAVYALNNSSSATAQAFKAATDNTSGFAIIGGAGCSPNSDYMGLQLGLTGMTGCGNYTLMGDLNGGTYLNASGTVGKILFRVNNVTPTPMILNNNGSVTITTLDVTTSLTKPAGSFKIDHPLDPANEYLYHSFVESPDMKNIYDGVTALDVNGEAVVMLPDWFGALNRDFRYQLTTIGGFAPVYIAEEVQNNQFKIAGGKPGIKVSWQVTGIRQDAFANAHRIQVEVEKSAEDRGHYLHPELFGAPQTARIGYESPLSMAPATERKSASAPRSLRPLIRPQPPLPVLPKLPALKTPPKPTVTRASK